MDQSLAGHVVVITGASSGIGRETALRFGQAGAHVVLAARNREALENAAAEVTRMGGEALVCPADVSDSEAIDALADAAVARFGRIDTWVNNAAISEYAPATEMTPAEARRIIEVNLLGQIYGSKAAVQAMRDRGGGTIINVASALALRAVPLQSVYCASKHGVRAFSESLRMELRHERLPIAVCVVEPSSVNTPLFSHARSRLGKQPQPIPPVYEPAAVAETILALARKPRREVVVGGSGKLLAIAQRFSPAALDWYMLNRGRMFRQQVQDKPDDGRDNLDAASTGPGASTGEFGANSKAASLYTGQVELHPARQAAALAVLAALVLFAVRRAGR